MFIVKQHTIADRSIFLVHDNGRYVVITTNKKLVLTREDVGGDKPDALTLFGNLSKDWKLRTLARLKPP